MKSIEWKKTSNQIEYPDAVSWMESRVASIFEGVADESVWLLEHPPLYTAGTSTNPDDMLDPRFPVYETGRGGEYTYHGPGQRVAYVMLNLAKRDQKDLRKFVWNLEEWIIRSLAELGVHCERRQGRVGLWVSMNQYKKDVLSGTEAKIAAIGVRVRKWVTYHGVAINLNPDLSHFGGIVPCGIKNHGVTSLMDLGIDASMDELDQALQKNWGGIFDT